MKSGRYYKKIEPDQPEGPSGLGFLLLLLAVAILIGLAWEAIAR